MTSKKMVGKYLTNNNYYVGSVDVENKKIWVSVGASDRFTEFVLQQDDKGNYYFIDAGEKVKVTFPGHLYCEKVSI